MPPAEPRSWRDIASRIGGPIAAVLALLVVGVGAGHMTLSNGRAVLGGFAIGARDDGLQAPHGHDRIARHAAREAAGGPRGRAFAHRRGCRDRHCVKAEGNGDPKSL